MNTIGVVILVSFAILGTILGVLLIRWIFPPKRVFPFEPKSTITIKNNTRFSLLVMREPFRSECIISIDNGKFIFRNNTCAVVLDLENLNMILQRDNKLFFNCKDHGQEIPAFQITNIDYPSNTVTMILDTGASVQRL